MVTNDCVVPDNIHTPPAEVCCWFDPSLPDIPVLVQTVFFEDFGFGKSPPLWTFQGLGVRRDIFWYPTICYLAGSSA